MLVPDWLAVMEQVPVVRSVTVVPDTVQIKGLFEPNATVRPDVADADTLTVPAVTGWLPGPVKEIVCVRSTLKVCVTCGAGP